MSICIVAATQLEIQPLLEYLKSHYTEYQPFHFIKGEKEVDILITGVGNTQTVYGITKYLQHKRPDICIQLGIAGAFKRSIQIGAVVNVVEEIQADLGVENEEGIFQTAFEINLIHPEQAPFTNGKLVNPHASEMDFLPKVKGITTNTVSGSLKTIKRIMNQYHPEVESMEGAGFFYVCLSEQIQFLQIRGISNFIEERNRENWDIKLAVSELSRVGIAMIESL